MASKGVHVKALDSRPELTTVDVFFLSMYSICGTDISKIKIYCDAYGMTNEEFLEAVFLLGSISLKV